MKLKTFTKIALIVFFVFMVVVFVGGKIYKDEDRVQGFQSETVLKDIPTGVGIILSMNEISKHSSVNDCYLVINNNVYNLTKYIHQHPGGAREITNWCGKEASNAFRTRGGTGTHSSFADNQLNGYLVGFLGSSINSGN